MRLCPQTEEEHSPGPSLHPCARTRYLPSDEMAMQRTWDACPMCRSSVPFFPPGTTHSLFPLSTSPAGKSAQSPSGSLPPLPKVSMSLPQNLESCTIQEKPRAKPPQRAPGSLQGLGLGTASHSPRGTLAFDEGAVLGSRKNKSVIRRDDEAGNRQLVPPQHTDPGWIWRLYLQEEQDVSWAAQDPSPGTGAPQHSTLTSPWRKAVACWPCLSVS